MLAVTSPESPPLIRHLASTVLIPLLLASCSRREVTPPESHGPAGERFPTVAGTGLDDRPWTLPGDLAGGPAILLVGYIQRAQFDIDRWLIGLLQVEPPARVIEIPAIEGWAPRLASGSIDGGMRQGIPQEDWGSVVTVYRDARLITDCLGRENEQNAQVVLLDASGTIRWFHNRGFSAGVLLELDALARSLANE